MRSDLCRVTCLPGNSIHSSPGSDTNQCVQRKKNCFASTISKAITPIAETTTTMVVTTTRIRSSSGSCISAASTKSTETTRRVRCTITTRDELWQSAAWRQAWKTHFSLPPRAESYGFWFWAGKPQSPVGLPRFESSGQTGHHVRARGGEGSPFPSERSFNASPSMAAPTYSPPAALTITSRASNLASPFAASG